MEQRWGAVPQRRAPVQSGYHALLRLWWNGILARTEPVRARGHPNYATHPARGPPVRWVRVLPVLVLVAFTAYSIATQPSSPAASPIPPSALIDASPDVRDCMLSTTCSGLFADGVVEKSPVLKWPTENALGGTLSHVLDTPGVPPHLKGTIRNRIMPTLADWTHSNLVETIDAPSWKVLRWFSDVGQDGAPSCVTSEIAWSGCADSSGNGNAVTVKPYLRGIPVPPDILYGARASMKPCTPSTAQTTPPAG